MAERTVINWFRLDVLTLGFKKSYRADPDRVFSGVARERVGAGRSFEEMKNTDSGRGIVHRSRNQKIIAGVCGGIAETLNMPPTLVRVFWVLLSFIPGPLWVAYVLMWMFVPKAPAVRY